MWLLFAFGSAFFAGLTGILAKCGIKNTDSNVATALRTIVVLIFSWILVFMVGSQNTIGDITLRTLLFLVLSGLATGASWLCYFRALQIGDINKVIPVDKSSTVLTMLLAFIFLREELKWNQSDFHDSDRSGYFSDDPEERNLWQGRVASEENKGKRKIQKMDRACMADLCTWQCGICQSDFHPWKSRNPGSRVQSGNRHPYHSGSDHGMGRGICKQKTAYHPFHRWKKRAVPDPFRISHRRLLVVLLPGASKRPCQRGSAN